MPKSNIFSVLTEFIPTSIKSRIPRRRYLILIAVILIILYLLWPKGGKTEAVQFAQVKKQDIATTISASGVLDGQNDVALHFNSGGKLAYLNFKQGDSIDKGTQVAGLDVQALQINLQQAQNNLNNAQAAVDKVLDDIHLNQYGNGGFAQVGSSQETETQRQTRIAAQTARDNAADSVKSAQRAFQDAVLYAPLSGIVVQSKPVPGQNVTVADTIIQIADNTKIIFAADVDEADLGSVSIGQPVTVSLNAYPSQTFNGTVSEVSPVTKTTTSGATVVTVKIDLQNPPTNFVVGLNGQADIKTKQASNVLTIPIDALRDDNTVYIQDGKTFKAVPVQTGIQSDTDVQITGGLTEGQNVVINPTAVKTPAPLPFTGGH
jgi:HlyD family secretion protein